MLLTEVLRAVDWLVVAVVKRSQKKPMYDHLIVPVVNFRLAMD
jgi:hypothetical protein